MALTNEDITWERLMLDIGNPYGVAGLMGNLFAESTINPVCKTGGDKSVTGKEYALMVQEGVIDPETFVHDGVAFGIAQWRYWSRKEALFLYCRENNKDISDLDAQIDYLLKEIRTYKTVWDTLLKAKTVKEASDIVLERYEKPANVGDSAKKKRAEFGQQYYDRYLTWYEPTPIPSKVRTTTNNVNLREGNSKSYAKVGVCNKAGTEYPYVATADNGWHAIVTKVNNKKRVVWISGDYTELL